MFLINYSILCTLKVHCINYFRIIIFCTVNGTSICHPARSKWSNIIVIQVKTKAWFGKQIYDAFTH